MSVLSHLESLGSNLVLTTNENRSINTSINTIESRLSSYFDSIEEKFVFGSNSRGTILPRNVDENSDVDYMVIFNDGKDYTPQTLLNRLKTFVEEKYCRSEIHQSSPTIVLELNHIKFELVPAYKNWSTIYIPAPASSYTTWISSNPNQMKTNLTNKNVNCSSLIKPLVRILKYWNVRNGKVYTSYDLEKYVIDRYFFYCTNLEDYFFDAVEGLQTFYLPEYKKNKVNRLKANIHKVKEYLRDEMPISAESELKKEIPAL